MLEMNQMTDHQLAPRHASATSRLAPQAAQQTKPPTVRSRATSPYDHWSALIPDTKGRAPLRKHRNLPRVPCDNDHIIILDRPVVTNPHLAPAPSHQALVHEGVSRPCPCYRLRVKISVPHPPPDRLHGAHPRPVWGHIAPATSPPSAAAVSPPCAFSTVAGSSMPGHHFQSSPRTAAPPTSSRRFTNSTSPSLTIQGHPRSRHHDSGSRTTDSALIAPFFIRSLAHTFPILFLRVSYCHYVSNYYPFPRATFTYSRHPLLRTNGVRYFETCCTWYYLKSVQRLSQCKFYRTFRPRSSSVQLNFFHIVGTRQRTYSRLTLTRYCAFTHSYNIPPRSAESPQ